MRTNGEQIGLDVNWHGRCMGKGRAKDGCGRYVGGAGMEIATSGRAPWYDVGGGIRLKDEGGAVDRRGRAWESEEIQ